MSVAKYAYYEFNLLQAVSQVERIEKYRPLGRDSKQKSHTESQTESFASLFQKATQKHAQAKKHGVNGFDVLC